jgi:hypothetical protein
LAEFVRSIVKEVAGKSSAEKAHLEGNSEAEILRYCRVVGNYRSAKDCLQAGRTVRDATNAAFVESVKEVREGINDVCRHSGSSDSVEQIADILETLCKKQKFLITLDSARLLCDKLAEKNITRPVSSEQDSYEFHRFSTEVAIRALLKVPVNDAHVNKMKKQVPQDFESMGRGTAEDIDALVPEVEDFETRQASFLKLLKLEAKLKAKQEAKLKAKQEAKPEAELVKKSN